jgi:Flp pilus assembly pilin Flp
MLTDLSPVVHLAIARVRVQDADGQALVEYALLIALIAAVCIAAMGLLSGEISAMFQGIVSAL